MLKSLYIKNYAIIDEITIDFSNGFNVFTGETGAGKSIIVGALSFLIQGKADLSIIKSNENKAIIEGIFSIEEYMKPILDEASIEYDDELIVRRVIAKDGHNTIKINQCGVTLNFLQELLSEHIDIHSQKDSQFLLNKKNHLFLLDKYANTENELKEYSSKYSVYQKELNEYNDLLNNTYNEAELDFYKFDLDELKNANLKVEEEKELEEKENRYKQAEKYISSLSNSISLFDSEDGIKERLNMLLKNLTFDDNDIETCRNKIEEIYYSLDEEINNIKRILNTFTDSDLDINQVEERLYLYSKLKRKHNTNVEGLLDKQRQLQEKIDFFENKDIVLNEKKKVVDGLYNECLQIANKIHDLRINKATELEKNVLKQTQDLVLNNVNFKIDFKQRDLSINGIDDVEFFVSMNKGEELKPLKNVASGGEISRLMLALKTIFTSLSNTSLIIFDEIDTGVSGAVGLAMGQKMAQIAKDTQLISITHLASVAACASSHYLIYKKDNDISTNTYVKKLDYDEIINEISRISSADLSLAAVCAARELYANAQESVK